MVNIPNEGIFIDNFTKGKTTVIPDDESAPSKIAEILEAIEEGKIKPELKGFMPFVDSPSAVCMRPIYAVPNVLVSVEGNLTPMIITGTTEVSAKY